MMTITLTNEQAHAVVAMLRKAESLAGWHNLPHETRFAEFPLDTTGLSDRLGDLGDLIERQIPQTPFYGLDACETF
jgi:hypothetical protein